VEISKSRVNAISIVRHLLLSYDFEKMISMINKIYDLIMIKKYYENNTVQDKGFNHFITKISFHTFLSIAEYY